MPSINHSRLYLGAMLEYFQLWKEVRDKVKNLSIHVTNIEDKWEDFAELSAIMGKDSVAAMGGNEKPAGMPDEMISGPTISITPEKVLVLYDTAIGSGFEFNPDKIYKPTVPKDDADYSKQMGEALELWNLIADLYFQVKDNFYKIGSLRGAYGKLQPLGDAGNMERTPGQLALNFPTTMTFLLENDHPIFNRTRIFDKLGDEYFYWLNRSNIDMIRIDPPKYVTKAEIIKTTTDNTFTAEEGTVLVGLDFCKVTRNWTPEDENDPGTDEHEYPQNLAMPEKWDYNCATNQIKLVIDEKYTLSNILLIAVTLAEVID